MRATFMLVALIPMALLGCEPPQTCSTCSDEAGDTAASESSESTDDVGGDDVSSNETSTASDAETDDAETTDDAGTETTEGDACESAQSEPMADTSMGFQITNVGDTAIFVAATDDCTANDFRLRQFSWGSDVDALWSSTLASQGNECATMQPPCGFGCTNDDPEQFLRIEPGESADLYWDGYWWETVTVDGGCLSPECTRPVMCNAGRQAGVGDEFGLQAIAFSECTPGDFECDCQPGETSCVIYSYGGVGGEPMMFTQDFAFEMGSMIHVQFGN